MSSDQASSSHDMQPAQRLITFSMLPWKQCPRCQGNGRTSHLGRLRDKFADGHIFVCCRATRSFCRFNAQVPIPQDVPDEQDGEDDVDVGRDEV